MTMKILIIDDHQMFLDGIKSVLSLWSSPTLQIKTADTGMLALNLIDKEDFDSIILDIHMPKLDGFGLLLALKERQSPASVLVISASQKEDEIRRVIALGAKGFIPKESSAELLLPAVQAILNGHIFLPESLSHLLPEAESISQKTTDNILSPRQLETLQLIKKGLSNKQVAAVMNISENTVKHHVSALFTHFNVVNRTSCILAAQQQAIID